MSQKSAKKSLESKSMIEFLGPILIVLGPVCFTLSASLDHFFSPPNEKIEDIADLEKDHISLNLSSIFKSAKADSFDDPTWIESIRRYYHGNIRELQVAEQHFRSMLANIKQMKMGTIILGIIFIVIGSAYTASINLEIFEEPRDIILSSDIALVFLLVAAMLFIAICRKKYGHNARRFTEIMNSQRLLLGSVFMRGGERSAEDSRS